MAEEKSDDCPKGFDEVEFQAASILTNLANGGFPEGESSGPKSPQVIRKRKVKLGSAQKINKVPESFWCNDCKIPGFSKFGLKLHRRRVHGEKPSEQPPPVKMKVETKEVINNPSSASHSIKILTPLSLSNCEFVTLQLPVNAVSKSEKKSPTKPMDTTNIGNLPLIVQTLWSQSDNTPVIANITTIPQKILPKEDDKQGNREKEHTYVRKESLAPTTSKSIASERFDDEFETLPVHKAENTSKFTKCERCMLPFFTKAGLHHHYKSVHKLDIKPTKDFDWDRFEKLKKIQSKSKLMQADDNKQYRCHICGKSFPWKVSLSVHLKVHTGEKPFQCTVCKRSFSERCHLTDHMRLHTGEKPFQCHICSKSYTWRLSLQAHLKVHSGEKPFECPHCDKTFAQRTNMLKHLETRHTIKEERRVYTCPYCDKGYRCNKALKQHLLSHDHSYCINVDDDVAGEEVVTSQVI